MVILDHASIVTSQLERAVDFYVRYLNLHTFRIENDPIRQGKRRAMLKDARGREVLEIIELPELAHPSIPGRGGLHHLGFRLTREHWQELRSRLEAENYPYQEKAGRLFLRDADGLLLEVEYAASTEELLKV